MGVHDGLPVPLVGSAIWVEITLYLVWVVFHMLWAETITYKREKSMNRDDAEPEDGE